MDQWCKKHKIEHVFTQPGNPQQNAYVERFNRTVRYECLNQHLFDNIEEVQNCTTAWQYFYNHERPHMQLMADHLTLNDNKGLELSTSDLS